MIKDNQSLVEYLIAEGALKSPTIIKAFRAVERADFVPRAYLSSAYEDFPIPIGFGQTISQPYTVALMLEWLQPIAGQRILDVGSGSGWTTALLAYIVGRKGDVVGVDVVPRLVELGRRNLKKYRPRSARIETAGLAVGRPGSAPYDRILVSAAATSVPEELLRQLKPEGVMVIPVGTSILRIKKSVKGALQTESHEGFAFVPLLH